MNDKPSIDIQIVQSQKIGSDEMNSLIQNFKEFGWSISKNYINKLLGNKSNYIFYIKKGNEIISSIFFSNYLNRGWIGNSFTKKNFRELGYNNLIVSHVKAKYNLPLYLICRSNLLKHYGKLNFINRGKVYELLVENNFQTQPIDKVYTIDEIKNFDKTILGGNREIKINNIIKRKSTKVFVLRNQGNIQAYGLISNLNNAYRMGPIVFKNFDDSVELFTNMIYNNSIKRKNITAYVHEKYLDKLYETKIKFKIITDYILMSTETEPTPEINNQLFFYGRATG